MCGSVPKVSHWNDLIYTFYGISLGISNCSLKLFSFVNRRADWWHRLMALKQIPPAAVSTIDKSVKQFLPITDVICLIRLMQFYTQNPNPRIAQHYLKQNKHCAVIKRKKRKERNVPGQLQSPCLAFVCQRSKVATCKQRTNLTC